MAWRGRGRGRGWGGRGFGRQEPFVEFPDVELPDPRSMKVEKELVCCYMSLVKFWNNSCYRLEDGTLKSESKTMNIERYSDLTKPKTHARRGSIDEFLQYTSDNFPAQLIGGLKRRKRNPKKVQWNPHTDLDKLDLFEKLEEKGEGEEEDEEEDEDKEEDEEEGGIESDQSEDDYNQAGEFDDDEDEYNLSAHEDDGEQEY